LLPPSKRSLFTTLPADLDHIKRAYNRPWECIGHH